MSTVNDYFPARKLVVFASAFLLSVCLPGSAAGQDNASSAPPPSAGLSKPAVIALLSESLNVMGKAKDVLRLTSAKLPDLVPDVREFRRFDREVELARDEIYPAVTSATKLKDNPNLLRDAVRMYLALRILEQRCLRLSDHLGTISGGSQTSLSIVELANKLGRINLKLQPYVFRLVDAYQAESSSGHVEENMQWQGVPQTQGPVL